MTAVRPPTVAPVSMTSVLARAPVAAVGVLAVAAWGALVAWGASPYGRYLDHSGLDHSGLSGARLAAVVIAGWTLMVLAMMLPTALPMVAVVGSIGHRRRATGRLVSALVAGYVSTWVAVGGVAFLGDSLVHVAEDNWEVVSRSAWMLAPASLAAASAFQLSPLKDQCLRKCRSPRMVVLSRWRGRRPVREALLLGVEHGRHCVGCCWALMLVMFAVGGGNLGVMLAVGVAMAVEKNAPKGHLLTRPIALALGVAAIAAVVAHVV